MQRKTAYRRVVSYCNGPCERVGIGPKLPLFYRKTFQDTQLCPICFFVLQNKATFAWHPKLRPQERKRVEQLSREKLKKLKFKTDKNPNQRNSLYPYVVNNHDYRCPILTRSFRRNDDPEQEEEVEEERSNEAEEANLAEGLLLSDDEDQDEEMLLQDDNEAIEHCCLCGAECPAGSGQLCEKCFT